MRGGPICGDLRYIYMDMELTEKTVVCVPSARRLHMKSYSRRQTIYVAYQLLEEPVIVFPKTGLLVLLIITKYT